MPLPSNKPDRLYVVLAALVLAIIAATLLYGAYLEIREGAVHHKTGGMFLQVSEPVRFWIDVSIQVAIGLCFAATSLWLGLFRRL